MREKKLAVIIGIVVMFIVLCTSCVFIGYMVMGGNVGNDTGIKNSGDIRMSTVAVNGVAIPDLYKDSMKRTEIGNTDSRAGLSDTLRNNTDSNLNSFKVKENSDGIKKYLLDNAVVRIDISTGINRFACDRSYYFNNGYLYMADYYVGANHDKMYFANDIMYRHISPDGTVTDNAFGDINHCYLGNFALNEGKAFLK